MEGNIEFLDIEEIHLIKPQNRMQCPTDAIWGEDGKKSGGDSTTSIKLCQQLFARERKKKKQPSFV